MTNPVDKDSLKLNQPKRTPNHPTKSHIVKTKVDGKEKIIRFGQQGASTAGKPKEGESERMTAKRDSFKARHSDNIAKGPASAAYWANKVKWADGGSVRTNYAEGDSVKATPQNPALGSIAEFLKQTYDPRRTQQMQGLANFLGLPAAARTVERLSYGEPITNINKANVPILPDDTAETAMLVGPMAGPLAKYAKRVGTNLVQTAPYVARDIAQSMTAPTRSYVIKPKGGNWLAGSIEDAINPLKTNVPEFQDPKNAAINQWIDQKLGKYIKNEMGTPEDPVRALAEKWSVDKPDKLAEVQARIDAFGKKMAQTAGERGVPVENLTSMRQEMIGLEKEKELLKAKEGLHINLVPLRADDMENLGDVRYAQGFEPGGMGMSKQARVWEDLADVAIDEPSQAGSRWGKATLEANPWLSKVQPETPVYGDYLSTDNLGFKHLVDELRNATNPESGLPKNLLIDPDDLVKMKMADVVDRVSDINAWRATQKAEADKLIANNAATFVHKEYPTIPGTDVPNELGLRWVQFKPENATSLPKSLKIKKEGDTYSIVNSKGEYLILGEDTEAGAIEGLFENYPRYRPKNKELKKALKYEGDTMRHCVGGYCDDVASGNSKIFSLRDSKGMPHATVEVRSLSQDFDDAGDIFEFAMNRNVNPNSAATKRAYAEYVAESKLPQDRIVQIKGRKNEAPEEEYLPFVQDFVKSGQWSDVGDLQNTGLLKWDDKYLTRAEIDALSPADYDAFSSRNLNKDFAKGGSVSAYDPNKIDEIINGIDSPTGFAKGGEVDESKAAFGIYPKQRATPSSKETKAAMADAAQFAAEMMIPQTAMDAGLMLIPGGKIARKAGAALIAADASDAEAGALAKMIKAFHGARKPIEGTYDVSKASEGSIMGKGLNVSTDPSYPSKWAMRPGSEAPTVYETMVPIESIIQLEAKYPADAFDVLRRMRGRNPLPEGEVTGEQVYQMLRGIPRTMIPDSVLKSGYKGVEYPSQDGGRWFSIYDTEGVKDRSGKKFAKGGSVAAYDPDQIDAIANQFM